MIKGSRPKLLPTFPPAREVIEHLQRTGWIQPIKVQYPKEASPIEFFLADMEAGENELIDPLELPQAYLPSGVICSLFVFPPPPAKLGWHLMTAPSRRNVVSEMPLYDRLYQPKVSCYSHDLG